MNIKHLCWATLSAILIGCSSAPQSYTVSGTVDPSLNGTRVTMEDYHSNKIVAETVVKDGAFSFEGSIKGDSIRRINLSKQYANLILEGGDIVIDFANHNATGTELNRQLNTFMSTLNLADELADRNYADLKADNTLSDEEKLMRQKSFVERVKNNLLAEARTIISTNDNALGAFVMWKICNFTLTPEQFFELYSQGGKYINNLRMIQAAYQNMSAASATAEGKHFTDFTIANGNLDGTPAKLSDYVGKGKYVLVDFWASWCGPCRRAIPVIREVWEQYHGDRFEVLGVAVWDERTSSEKAIKELDLPWAQIIDAQDIPTDLYGIDGIPHIILFGPDGTIVARNLHGDGLKSTVAKLME